MSNIINSFYVREQNIHSSRKGPDREKRGAKVHARTTESLKEEAEELVIELGFHSLSSFTNEALDFFIRNIKDAKAHKSTPPSAPCPHEDDMK